MTCIAWDGTTLAADRLCVLDGCKTGRSIKIRRTHDGRLLGAAGWAGACQAMLDWIEHGGMRPPVQDTKDDASDILEVRQDGTVRRHERWGSFVVLSRPVCIGSGGPYAMTAMHFGCDARRAVEVACELDDGSAGPVDVLTLDPPP